MVEIAGDVFAWNDDNGSSNETVLLSGPFAEADGINALERVAARLLCVDDAGIEHTPEARDRGDIVGDDGEMRYTPNYVSDVTSRDDGLFLYVDCKGAIEPPMAQRFLEILREELAVLGDDVRVDVGHWA